MAPKAGIIGGLSDDHWRIIYFIREQYKKTGKCPLVYETTRMNRLHLQELKNCSPPDTCVVPASLRASPTRKATWNSPG
jgi:sulfur relay (sulfurtransferase) DsrC/TusE family protein